MDQYPYDKDIKGKLYDYELAPPADMYERIQKGRKKQIFPWKTFLGILAIFSIVGLLFLVQKNNIAKVFSNSENGVVSKEVESVNTKEISTELNTDQKNSFKNFDNNTTENKFNEKKCSTLLGKVDTKNKEKSKIAYTKKANDVKMFLSSKINKNEENRLDNTLNSNNDLVINNVDDKNISVKNISTSISIDNKNMEEQQKLENEISISTVNLIEENSYKIENVNTENVITENSLFTGVNKIPTLGFHPLKSQKNLVPLNYNKIIKQWIVKKGGCRPYDPRCSNWSIEAYGSRDFYVKSISASDDLENYVQLRTESERPFYSWSAGARVTKVLNSKWLVKSGVNYTALNEKFNFTRQDSTKILHTYTQVLNGQTVTVTDSVFQRISRVTNAYSRFSMVDIPFIVGYNFGSGKNFSMFLNGGLMANLLFSGNGTILNQNGQVERFSNSNSFYKNNIGISLFFSGQFSYRLSSTPYSFFLEPYFRTVLNPVNNPDYQVQSRYSSAGVLLGITRDL
jgi:hypothetical protein